MFDPASLVGIVGTTAGLISFVANTAEKLHDRKIEWQNCKELLAWYRAQYDTTHLRLRCWTNTWCGKDYSKLDAAYTYFWGIDGFNAIKQRMKLILGEDGNIRRLLYCESITLPELPQDSLESLRNDPHWTEWQRYLEDIDSCRKLQPQPERWMRRFCFALYKHSDIKTRITRLKEMVADLETFSKLTFWVHQEQDDTGSQVVSEHLSRLLRVRRATGRLEQFLGALGADSTSWNQWALVLGRPDLSESLISFEEDQLLTLEFLVKSQVATSDDRAVSVVHIDCPLTETELGNLRELRTLTVLPKDANRSAFQAVKEFLKQAAIEDDLRKVGELLRATVASELVNSLIVCYGTPCTRALCTCGVRATHLINKKRLWTFRAIQGRHPCHDQGLQDRGFFLLAVALAELAISSPINILQTMPDEFEFQVRGTKEVKTLRPAELLRDISHRSCRSYRKAVEYCFEMDRKLIGREIRPEDFPRCMNRIFEP